MFLLVAGLEDATVRETVGGTMKEKDQQKAQAAQQEFVKLADQQKRLFERIAELGRELDEPLSEAQRRQLEPESLVMYLAGELQAIDLNESAGDVVRLLRKLSEMSAEDVVANWHAALPSALAEDAASRAGRIEEAAAAIRAAPGGDLAALARAVRGLRSRIEDYSPIFDDLEKRIRKANRDTSSP
jgi:hypothetical protein